MPSNPTRFPYGISLVKPFNNPGFSNAAPILLQNSASTLYATPDITNGSYWVAANSGTITNFLNGEQGRLLFIKCTTGGCVIIQNSAPVVRLNNIVIGVTGATTLFISATAGNVTMLNGEVIALIHDGTGWVMESPRTVFNTQA